MHKYGIRRETISDHIRKGNIKAKKVKNQYQIDEESFLQWYNSYVVGNPRFNKHKKRNWNRNIFDNIDTPEKAYWLGMIMADGCVKSTGYVFSLDLGGKDREHILSFIKFINGEEDQLYITIHPQTGNELAHIQLSSKYFCDRLIELGIKPRKSGKETFIETDFTRDFIRGLIDGDGIIRTDLTEIGLVGSYELLSKVQQIFLNELDIKPNSIMEHGVIYKISYRSKKAIYKISKYLYENNTISLPRKQKLVNQIIYNYEHQL